MHASYRRRGQVIYCQDSLIFLRKASVHAGRCFCHDIYPMCARTHTHAHVQGFSFSHFFTLVVGNQWLSRASSSKVTMTLSLQWLSLTWSLGTVVNGEKILWVSCARMSYVLEVVLITLCYYCSLDRVTSRSVQVSCGRWDRRENNLHWLL